MSIRVDSSPLIAGAVVVGDPGLGVLAELVPSTGEHGAGYLYDSLEFPADTGKEVRGLITTWPTLGTLTAFEDSSFEYDGASDTFAFQMYVEGQPVDTPQTVTVTVGAGDTYNDSLSESVTLLDASSNGSLYTEVLTASVALSDALANTVTLTGAVTESMALSDALNALATFQATLSEAVAAGDFVATQSDQATLPRKALTARVQATSLSARLQ